MFILTVERYDHFIIYLITSNIKHRKTRIILYSSMWNTIIICIKLRTHFEIVGNVFITR